MSCVTAFAKKRETKLRKQNVEHQTFVLDRGIHTRLKLELLT